MPENPGPNEADDDLSPSLGGPASSEANPDDGFQATGSASAGAAHANAGGTANATGEAQASVLIEGDLGAVMQALSGNLSRALEQATNALERELPQAIDRLGRQVPEATARLEAQLPQALGAIERLANVFEAAFTPLFRPVAEAVDRMVPNEGGASTSTNPAGPEGTATNPQGPAGPQDEVSIPVEDEA